jgi:hypothetical protein
MIHAQPPSTEPAADPGHDGAGHVLTRTELAAIEAVGTPLGLVRRESGAEKRAGDDYKSTTGALELSRHTGPGHVSGDIIHCRGRAVAGEIAVGRGCSGAAEGSTVSTRRVKPP